MRERLTLFAQMAFVAAFSVVLVNQIPFMTETDVESGSRTEDLIDSQLNGQTLEVRPAEGRPVPLDQSLQAPRDNSNQEAVGDLQRQQDDNLQPQGQDSLQQSAGVDDLPEDYQL